ncbi:MAG: DUF1599 domain-containing protein [Flavobacteriales bacterium]|nr:DUF1599 domain-containing protein [Flavobacteriales bacterium]
MHAHAEPAPRGSTLQQFDTLVAQCKSIFLQKLSRYGPSWRHFRPASLADQMLIKARRIRTLEEQGFTAVGEGVETEYQALVNYAIITLLQMRFGPAPEVGIDPITPNQISTFYDEEAEKIRSLLIAKNQDYGDAWRQMLLSSLTDMIIVKIVRVRQLLINPSSDSTQEVVSNLQDICNYAIFALIRLEEIKE